MTTTLPADIETEALALRLALASGKPLARVVYEAIREKAAAAGLLQSGQVRLDREERFARMLALSEEFAELPVLDGREADDIIGYDEYGVPR